jgi:hypothetical protein
MEKRNLTNPENSNDANRFLAIMLISLVWMAVLIINFIFSCIFDVGELFIRFILTLPFSFGGTYASIKIWKHYR